jgi:hypothetical protein
MPWLHGIVGFIVYVLLIMLGARIAHIEKAGFWRCVAVALLSMLLVAVMSFFVSWLTWIPLVGGLVTAVVVFFGTAVAARLVFDSKWEPAWTIGFVVTVASLILSWLLPMFR